MLWRDMSTIFAAVVVIVSAILIMQSVGVAGT